MTTIYVNDLSGIDLDFWVARAEGIDAVRTAQACLVAYRRNDAGALEGTPYSPTRDPQVSALLIVKHGVDIFESGGRWAAEIKGRDTPWGNGATPVEAALRAIVAARFGDAVQDAEAALPLSCFWLMFVAAGSTPPHLLGHAIIEARDMNHAMECARGLGLHPGSDVRVYRVNDDDAHHIAADMRNRLLSAEEAASLGWQEQ